MKDWKLMNQLPLDENIIKDRTEAPHGEIDDSGTQNTQKTNTGNYIL